MKKLNQLYKCDYNVEVKGIQTNSKNVQPGDLFVCIEGQNSDGHDFVKDAISNGTIAIVSEKDIDSSVPVIKVTNTKEELRNLLNTFYGNPNDKYKFIGITGTSGKTTTSIIIYEFLKKLKNCAYIGSAGVLSNKFNLNETINTTPSICKLYNWLEYLGDTEYISMEISSMGLKQNRIGTIKFDIGVYTNISPNHLYWHHTFEDYKNSKLILFDNIKTNGFAILNIDDPYYQEFLSHCNCNVVTYGKNKDADIKIMDINLGLNSTIFSILYKNKKYKITTNFIGEFNVYNICAALSVALCIGIPIEQCIEVCKKIKIPAKVERIDYGQDFTLIFDTCHTTNAVNNLLNHLRLFNKKKIIVVASLSLSHLYDVEDLRKRAKAFTCLADYTIFTLDTVCDDKFLIDNYANKLGENLNKRKYEICIDNNVAIKKAITMASSKDIVVVTGYYYFYGLNKNNVNPYLVCKKSIDEYISNNLFV